MHSFSDFAKTYKLLQKLYRTHPSRRAVAAKYGSLTTSHALQSLADAVLTTAKVSPYLKGASAARRAEHAALSLGVMMDAGMRGKLKDHLEGHPGWWSSIGAVSLDYSCPGRVAPALRDRFNLAALKAPAPKPSLARRAAVALGLAR